MLFPHKTVPQIVFFKVAKLSNFKFLNKQHLFLQCWLRKKKKKKGFLCLGKERKYATGLKMVLNKQKKNCNF